MSKRVLVVEDNELNLKLFCDLLRAHDYTTEPVRDGREAVERARAFAPDLIVMDIQLPHVSGLELIETCKADAELRGIPIMAVTAYAGKEDEDRVRAAGAEAYVSKPISLMRFVGEVAALTPADAARDADTVAVDDPPEDEVRDDVAVEDALPEDEPDGAADAEDFVPEDEPPLDALIEDIPDENEPGEDIAIEGEPATATVEEIAEEAGTSAPEDAVPAADPPADAADDGKPI